MQQVNSVNVGAGTNGTLTIPELQSLSSSKKDVILKPEADLKIFIGYDFYPLDNPHYHESGKYGFQQVIDRAQKLFTPQFNHISMKLPPFPLLANLEATNKLQFCNESTVDSDCDVKYCECTHVLKIPLDAVVELILVDKG